MIRRLLGHSVIYFVSNVAMRAMTVVLAPIYTRKLSPESYGELALANTIGAVVTLAASLALPAALARYAPTASAEERARITGSAIATSLGASAVCLGAAAMYHHSYMSYVLATSALSFGQGLAVQSFAARERSFLASLVNVAAVLSWLGFTLVFVVVQDRGIEGALLGGLVASACTCALSTLALARVDGVAFSAETTRRMLRFSLPLIPHLGANWVLSISDRMLIERYAGKAALAPYVVAYFFNIACVMFTSSLAQALSPIFVREAEQRGEGLPLLGDVCVAASVICGLALCMIAPWVFPLIAPNPAYAVGLSYVPWVVLGALFQGVYFVISQGSWYSEHTKLVPIVTAIAAAANLGANILLLPRYGAIAAAWSTAIAYAVLALAHGVLASRLYPVRWHYGRWAAAFAVGAVIYVGVTACAS